MDFYNCVMQHSGFAHRLAKTCSYERSHKLGLTEMLSRFRTTVLMVSWHLSICPEGSNVFAVFVCICLYV